jgi:23S rRNA (adenine2503-C2)-methyltransferase
MSKEAIATFLQEHNQPKFRLQQIWEWLWKRHPHSIDEMNNLSKELRNLLQEHFTLNPIKVQLRQTSEDGTIKTGFQLYDGYPIEGVLIPTTKRLTACISSQVGCSLTCAFCATGQMDRQRNLNYDEIYDQVALINQQCLEIYQKKLTNIVFMGMGEPLLNYNHMMRAVERITAEDGLAMSPSRITVSTAGIAKMIKQVADDQAKFKLALSLHAATDEKRNTIMPINETNNLKALINALEYYFIHTKKPITYEYILFNELNDTEQDAKNLVKLSRRIPSKVNIIEYNPVAGTSFMKPTEQRTSAFMNYLETNGINARLRRSRGKDIDAACGQLANKMK